MKKTIPIIIFIALLAGAISFGIWRAKSAPAADRTGLTLDLNFGNNNGSATAPTVFDSSGYGRNATSTAGTTAPTCGGKFCDFDGGDIMSGDATNVFGSSISYAIKFRPDFAPSEVSNRHFFSSTGNNYRVFKNTVATLAFFFGGTEIDVTSANYQNLWKVGADNVLIVVSTTGNSKFWLNGVQIGTSATPWSASSQTAFYVGNDSTKANGWDGKIYYMKVWNRLLTDAEVQNLSADRTGFTKSAPRTGLVGYWTMDSNDVNGTTLYDKSGLGNNGTLTGTSAIAGKINQAMSFNGTSDWVSLPSTGAYNQTGNLTFDDTDNFTLSIWYKGTDTGGDTLGKGLIGWSDASTYATFALRSGYAEYIHYGGGWQHNIKSNTMVADNKWHHIVYVNNSNQTGSLYIDGVAEITGQSSAIEAGAYFKAKEVGRSVNDSSQLIYTSGSLDDVRIYNYALSAAEVSQLYDSAKKAYTASAPMAGLVGWWKMDVDDMSATGATMFDKSGQNNHGTVTGTTTSTGRINQSRTLNGTSDYITVSDNASLRFGVGNFTLSAWIKTTATAASNFILDKYGAGGGGGQYDLYVTSLGKLSGFTWNGAYGPLITGNTAVTNNKWHNVVLVIDSSGTSGRVYLDGVQDGSATGATAKNSDSNGTLLIGKNTVPNYFTGSIDDVRIYNRALSAAEVSQLYESARKSYVR